MKHGWESRCGKFPYVCFELCQILGWRTRFRARVKGPSLEHAMDLSRVHNRAVYTMKDEINLFNCRK